MLTKIKPSTKELNAYTYSFGAAIRNAVFVFGTVIFANHWTKDQIGDLEGFIFLSTIFPLFLFQPFNNAAMASYSKLSIEERLKFRASAFWLFFLIGGFSFLVWRFIPGLICIFTSDGEYPQYHIFYAIIASLQPFPFLLTILYFLEGKVNRQIVFTIGSVLVGSIFYIFPVFYSLDPEWNLGGWIILLIFQTLWTVVEAFDDLRQGITFKVLKQFGVVFYPFFIYSLLASLPFVTDNLIVNFLFQDKSMFAEFRIGIKEIPILLLVTNAINSLIVTEISTNGWSSWRLYKEKYINWIWLTFLISIASVIASVPIFDYYLEGKYQVSATLFRLMTILWSSRILFSQSILIGAGLQKFIIPVGLAEFILNCTLSLLFGYFFGLKGVVFGTLIAYFTEKLLYFVLLYKKLKITPNQVVPLKEYLIALTLLILTFICIEMLF